MSVFMFNGQNYHLIFNLFLIFKYLYRKKTISFINKKQIKNENPSKQTLSTLILYNFLN